MNAPSLAALTLGGTAFDPGGSQMLTRSLGAAAAALALSFVYPGTAYAWHIQGTVRCEQNGLPLGNVIVDVNGSSTTGPFQGSAVTADDGTYVVALPDTPGSYDVTLDLSLIGGGTSTPASFHLDTQDGFDFAVQDFVVSSPACQQLGCWLTGGGAKFSSITGTYLAEKGPQVNFGGNVNPGCSATAGDGGDWNHLDKNAKLHFHGTAITVDRCGNVDGIPPGSTSPATPFNFIEFHGTGTLKGISGNKVSYDTVCFQGRAEDRNEPGSTGVHDGALKDRYFIRVTDCAGTTLLVLEDSPPGSSTPVTITDGNLQIHVSSCQ